MSEKNITARVLHKYDTTKNWESVEGTFIPDKGELIVYADSGSKPKIKIGNKDQKLGELKFVSTEDDVKVVPYPYPKSVLSYNGKKQKPQWEYNSGQMFISSETSEDNAGTYTTTFTLLPGYCWNDKSTTQYDAKWTINQVNAFSVDKSQITLSVDTRSDVIPITSVNYDELSTLDFEATFTDSSLTCEVEDIFNITLSVDKKYLTVEVAKDFDYSETISVNISLKIEETKNFVETLHTITATVEATPTLDSMTWQEIQQICADGNAESYFKIGDMKKVDLSNLEGWGIDSEVLNEVYVFIIGFNYNKDAETPDAIGDTIHFSGFKKLDTVTKNYVDCVLYRSDTGEVTVPENIYGDEPYMEWNISQLRTALNREEKGYLRHALGADLTNVIIPMNKSFAFAKYVDMGPADPGYWDTAWTTGGDGNGEYPSKDIISILDVGESSNTYYEEVKDTFNFEPYAPSTPYSYYATNSSTRKNINNVGGNFVNYSLRSKICRSVYDEMTPWDLVVDTEGNVNYSSGGDALKGIAPIFCVGKLKEN